MANKESYQSTPPDVQVRPPPPAVPQPYPEPESAPTEIYYPSTDGKPLADDTWQANTMISKYNMLTARYRGHPNTFVGIDLLLYYTKDKPEDVVAPDVFVAFGVPDKDRHNYKVWEEGKVPNFVLEVASQSSVGENLGRKKDIYERIGVREYCVFDPQGCLHWPRLQLFRLEGGVYKQVSMRGGPDGPLAVTSETLGLELRFKDDRLRLWDPETQEYLLEYAELRAGRLEERAKRMEERAGRLEEHTGRLEERAKRIAEEQRAAQAKRRADQAEQRAEAEALARQKLEAEIAEFKAQRQL